MNEARRRWRHGGQRHGRRLRDWLRRASGYDKPSTPGFRLVRLLSSPEQSTRVYLARRTDGPYAGYLVALKVVLNASRAQREGLLREHQIAQDVVSWHIVRTYEVDAEATPPWLTAELIPGRDLRKVAPLRRADRYLAAAQAIADGLADLHRQGYAHCDLKPENLVADRSGRLAFIDLKWCRRAGDPEVVVVTGTAGWMAPERHAGGLDVPEEQRADVFSAGLTLYFLWTGRHLLDDQPDTAQQMINNHYAWNPADLDVLPEEIRPVIKRALNYDRGLRPTAEELRAEIRRASVTQVPRPWPTPLAKAAAITLVLAVGAGIIVDRLRPEDSRCPQVTYKSSHDDTVLRIGGLISYTGPITGRGESQSAALRLAVNDVRAAWTSPRYRVEYQQDRDEKDEGDPATDTICGSVDALLHNQTDVIIGPALSASTLKVLNTVTAAGSLLVAVSTAPELSTYPDRGRFLRTAASDELQGRVLSRQILDDGGGSVAVLTRDDAYGNGFRNVITRSLTENGARLALVESYDPTAANYDSLARRVGGAHPDAIVLVGFEESATILRALIGQDVTPRDTRIYGTDGNMSASLPGQVDQNKPGVLDGMRGTTLLPFNEDFRRRLETITRGPIHDLTYAAEVYDAVIVVALAAAAAGTPNPDDIAHQAAAVTRTGERCNDYKTCLELIRQKRDIDYDGISGPLDLTDSGEPCRRSYAIIKFDERGDVQRLRTAEASNLCV